MKQPKTAREFYGDLGFTEEEAMTDLEEDAANAQAEASRQLTRVAQLETELAERDAAPAVNEGDPYPWRNGRCVACGSVMYEDGQHCDWCPADRDELRIIQLSAAVVPNEKALRERDAALAAAHEALRAVEWGGPSDGTGCILCLGTNPSMDRMNSGHEPGDCLIDRALSAPALQRAARELELLRELVSRAQRALVLAAERWPELKEIQAELAPPLVALQRFREEQNPQEPRG